MIGTLVARELTISFRRETVHLLVLAQTLAALGLVAAGERLAQQATPWNPPTIGSSAPSPQSGALGVVASHLDGVLFLGEVLWLILFCLAAVPAIAGPAIARERERGTLPVLLGTGATPLGVVGAKAVATLAQTGLLALTGLPALGLVLVFGSPEPALLLGGAALVIAWGTLLVALGLLCSALARSDTGASAAALAAGVALLLGPALAPFGAARLGVEPPGLAYRLNLPAAALSLEPGLRGPLVEALQGGGWLKALASGDSPFGPPWLPFVVASLITSIVLVLLASAAVARSPGRAG